MRLSMEKQYGLKDEITECQEETEQVLQARARLAVEEAVDRARVGVDGSADLMEIVYVLPAGMKLPIRRESPVAR
jgi:hypothetical protein